MSDYKKKKVDWGLRFYREVLNLDNLHLGMWSQEDPFNLEGARAAQARYTDTLIGMIPEKVKTILDVGCGTGVTAMKLKDRAYDVECVNPDSYQKKIFDEITSGSIKLYNSSFADLAVERKYDLILMSESSQYIDSALVADKTKELLTPGGSLLIADYFRKQDDVFYKTCKIKDEFLKLMKDAGYNIDESLDITAETLPNLELGKSLYDKYALPIYSIAGDYLAASLPMKGLITALMRKKLRKINYYVYEHTPEKLNAEKFISKMEYLFILFSLER